MEDYEKLAMNVLQQEGAEGPTSEQWKTLQEDYARLSLSYQDLRKECELKNYKDGHMEQLQDKLNKLQKVFNNKKDENEKLKTQAQRGLRLKRHLYSAHRHNKELEMSCLKTSFRRRSSHEQAKDGQLQRRRVYVMHRTWT